jgi:hypothetical protein
MYENSNDRELPVAMVTGQSPGGHDENKDFNGVNRRWGLNFVSCFLDLHKWGNEG